ARDGTLAGDGAARAGSVPLNDSKFFTTQSTKKRLQAGAGSKRARLLTLLLPRSWSLVQLAGAPGVRTRRRDRRVWDSAQLRANEQKFAGVHRRRPGQRGQRRHARGFEAQQVL